MNHQYREGSRVVGFLNFWLIHGSQLHSPLDSKLTTNSKPFCSLRVSVFLYTNESHHPPSVARSHVNQKVFNPAP